MLLHESIFLLLAIVVTGELAGRARIGTFSCGSSAVVFVALAFGHFGYVLPRDFQVLGLVLFVYSIGIQAGPGFVGSFRTIGLRLSAAAAAMIAAAVALAGAGAWLFGFDAGTAAGLLAGAMTSTPGLAVAVELTDGRGAAAAYGVTYVFGVVGVILFIRLLPKLLRVDLPREERELEQALADDNPPVQLRHLEVTNPNVFGKTAGQLHLTQVAPVTITRLLRAGSDSPDVVTRDTALEQGDCVRVVGREADLDTIQLLIGHPVDRSVEFARAPASRDIVVSRPDVVGMTLGSMNLRGAFNVQVGRITRNGIDLPADPSVRILRGDVLRIIGDAPALQNIKRLLGDDVKATYRASVLTLSVGLLLGFLLGEVPVAVPGAGDITLGIAGGVLVSGLILGALHKTGPFIWEIPSTTNAFVRDLGLMLFLATVGTGAGATVVETLATQGPQLVIAGVAVTLLPMVLCVALARGPLRIHFLRVLGVIPGGMTSTPGLATATSLSETPHAASAYAAVYPVALVGMILAVKLLIALLG